MQQAAIPKEAIMTEFATRQDLAQIATVLPENRQRALTWGQFRNRGIETATGHLTSRAAAVQVLILPVLIFLWGVSIAVIAALT